ncbi:cyclodeaminase/cyclohydrolase family protein [Halococcus hamelinensis]|uniref:Formimidoyltetrahydrofolate cyclodeaminase n=1 Tax=Halococcus hamelinensis 100A6 TaxID=1132509 RepID=M0LWG6_9EURY|nr:cyclodeaminase/cyclohydrolase family protein [Halococcus hamelinensis]EMA36699.1 formimidoyltetrahydrofolate cyclodeaminase [Halococcus hamelinensis 100A6]
MTFANQPLDEFLASVAAPTVTPSGGAVAAVGGAFGAALCEMACIHTVEKEGYANVHAEFGDRRDELAEHRARLLELADEDARAVEELQAAFETSDDDGRAELVHEKALRAVDVPVAVAESCLDILEHATAATANGNTNAIADAGTGALLTRSVLRSSVLTARTNLELLEDTATVSEIDDRLDTISNESDEALSRITSNLERTG